MRISSWSSLYLLLGVCLHGANGREPFKARNGSIPFVVYFMSRYRGLCVGTLVSRMAVLTAAVCVTNPKSTRHDTRPINVVVGTSYRHPRRGIRVQVTKLLIPKFVNVTNRLYLMEKSTAILLLKHKIPAVITEVPLRALDIDYKKELVLSLQEECLMPGWHFFHRGPDRTAQPCHGMYGAPLVCQGRAVAMLMAPDAQWTNCTGYSNIVHLFSSNYLRPFMTCVSSLFESDIELDWNSMKKAVETINSNEYDYLPQLYDKVASNRPNNTDVDFNPDLRGDSLQGPHGLAYDVQLVVLRAEHPLLSRHNVAVV
ncbi:hypothetical protein K1T71_000509 [Dendrolimus kikuchii]|uniref:Uncharacterized protein n=1 Tax=Dendrolimus kikuchii TaxID=765133 RepID=A0ACC1DJS1_9NEOP|nr:hypothetical protein K1T71_000509 [Dendrolimus kikuchii]